MDISTNELSNPSIPEAVAPYMLSKYARSYLEALTSGQEDIVAKGNAQSAVVKSFVEGEVSRLDGSISNLTAETQQSSANASNDRQAIRNELANAEATLNQSLADEVATLNQSIADEVATLNNVDVALRVDVDDLLQWRIDNTDEIAGEIDKAINEKVDETLFEAVKTALETADTQFSQDLAQSITDRQNKDAVHTALLERMEAFVNVVLALNEVEDGDGNVLNSFADVLASTSVALPMSIVSNILAEYVRDETNDITISTVANRDAGKLVRAHFTLPAGVSLSYQEGGQGAYIPLVDVFGPASGFPLGDISSEFELQVSASGSYSVLVEFKEVANGNVLGSKTLSFEVVEPASAPAPAPAPSSGVLASSLGLVDGDNFTNLVPEINPAGEAVETFGAGAGNFNWSFNTTNATNYDMFLKTDNFAAGDEQIVSIEKATEPGVNIINEQNVIGLTQGLSLDNGSILLASDLDGDEKVGVLVLEPNTEYNLSILTGFNDPGPDVAMSLRDGSNVIELFYVSTTAQVVSSGGGSNISPNFIITNITSPSINVAEISAALDTSLDFGNPSSAPSNVILETVQLSSGEFEYKVRITEDVSGIVSVLNFENSNFVEASGTYDINGDYDIDGNFAFTTPLATVEIVVISTTG